MIIGSPSLSSTCAGLDDILSHPTYQIEQSSYPCHRLGVIATHVADQPEQDMAVLPGSRRQRRLWRLGSSSVKAKPLPLAEQAVDEGAERVDLAAELVAGCSIAVTGAPRQIRRL